MRKRSRSEINRLNAAGPGDASIVPSGGGSAAHQLHHYLRLAAALGANPEPLAPYLEVSREEVETARQKFSLRAGALWLALNPGAEYGPAKRWPRERFVEAAAQIQSRTNCRWIVLGGANDAELATTTASEIGQLTARNSHPAPINLAGRTSLRELCAVLKACRVLLTNDTGPMHVAAAVGTPVVAIFGSTSPNLTGPGLPGDPRHHLLDSNAPCSPCFLRECPIDFRCMRGVPVERVANAVMSALDR
ncbi:MAG: lipopolysaccharide heptosyltransferase II [Verrucomicrobia bacterium]|nr:MAG: lipopolysaccharide heptosyltransferase II [Verrucomicrobiota bacterium]